MLTAQQLFTPEQSGVGLDPNVTPADDTWLGFLLATANIVGLDATSWQPGSPERTILAIASVALAQEDTRIAVMAQGGFLDYAASGTVTSVAIDGSSSTQPVTPDPSIPSQNPTGALGWLDALGSSFYEVDRLLATYATGYLSVANTGAGALNYVAGNYHVANASTGATYVNVNDQAVPSSRIAGTGGVITAVSVGNPTTITTQSAHGLALGDVVYVAGALGVTGLSGVFGAVSATPSATSFRVNLSTTGTWTSAGTVYKCTLALMQADVLGITSNASPGAISLTVTQASGAYVSNISAWSAANYESNTAYVARIRLSLAALSPNGPASAYDYYALSAATFLAALSPPVTLTNGPIAIATTFANPQTSVVTCYVSSTSPASVILGEAVTPGCAQLGITGATNATPIVITTATAHGLADSDAVIISGVLGNTAANAAWLITVLSGTTFSLSGSVGSGAYTGGGMVEGGDLGQIDDLIQDNVVPDDVTAVVASALAFPITVVATVVVPQAYLSTYQAAAPIALTSLLASYPIGGNVPPGGTAGTVPWSAVEGALVDAGVLTVGQVSYVRQVSALTVNGNTGSDPLVEVEYPAPEYVAILVVPTINIIGV